MENYLARMDKGILRIIRKAAEAADFKGFKAYLVGGSVRDIILGHKNFDLDIVVEGDALEIALRIVKTTRAKLVSHKQFKTASLRLSSSLRIDLATARNEFYLYPGALPQVKKGILKDDLLRRDFTINALAICINGHKFGQLIDPFNGLEDLKKGYIRILHEKSFIDDPTRILRAIRFEQRFGFRIEEKTFQLLQAALKNHLTENVKPPRYFAEFKKILMESKPLKYVRRLDKLGGLGFIAPHVRVDYKSLRRLEQALGKKSLQLPEGVKEWLLYFMALVGNLSFPALEKNLDKLHFRKEDKEAVLAICRSQDLKARIFSSKILPSQVYSLLKSVPLSAIFYLYINSNQRISSYLKRFLAKDRDVQLAINGDDLKELGLKSGPEIGNVLEHLLCQKIDGKISGKEEELELARQFLEVP